MTFVYVVCSRYMMSIPIIVHVQCLNVKLFPKASHDWDIVCYDNECVLTMMIRWLAGLVVERLELETKVHPKIRNHGEGPYYGLLLHYTIEFCVILDSEGEGPSRGLLSDYESSDGPFSSCTAQVLLEPYTAAPAPASASASQQGTINRNAAAVSPHVDR